VQLKTAKRFSGNAAFPLAAENAVSPVRSTALTMIFRDPAARTGPHCQNQRPAALTCHEGPRLIHDSCEKTH